MCMSEVVLRNTACTIVPRWVMVFLIGMWCASGDLTVTRDQDCTFERVGKELGGGCMVLETSPDGSRASSCVPERHVQAVQHRV